MLALRRVLAALHLLSGCEQAALTSCASVEVQGCSGEGYTQGPPVSCPGLVPDESFSLPRWKNWWVRGILTLAMIAFFFIIIYLGPMVLMMIVSTIDKPW